MRFYEHYEGQINPRTPGCSDERVQQLRDLWRPTIQENWQPHSWIDPQTRVVTFRDEQYDTTQASLWVDYPMYVVPPTISEPLTEVLEENIGGPMFVYMKDRARATLHGADRFMNRFLWPDYASSLQIKTNFTGPTAPTRALSSGFDTFPRVDMPAPLLERRFDFEVSEVRYMVNDPNDNGGVIFGEMQRERRRREGVLGWTIPISSKQSNFAVRSLLRAKNHIATVHWFNFPAERLSITFPYPQLSRLGETMLSEAVARLEPAIPDGTIYSELYNYHERSDWVHPSAGWEYTEEANARRKREFDRHAWQTQHQN